MPPRGPEGRRGAGRLLAGAALLALALAAAAREAPREAPYVVGAYYFGAFAPSATGVIEGNRRVHGRQGDWWGGVSDFYGAEPGIAPDRRGWAGEWPHLKPAIGYYDQRSVKTLERHIRQASDAGLGFFSFYWYWSDRKRGELLPEALLAFRAARNPAPLRFNLSLFAHPWDEDMAITEANAEEVARRIASYFSDPNYLRLQDGRPVFAIGDNRNFRDPAGRRCGDARCHSRAVARFVAKLRRISRETAGADPFVQMHSETPGWDSTPEVDGVTCLMPPMTLGAGTPYPRFRLAALEPLGRAAKPVSPCMLQNFDERPRQDVLVRERSAIRYFVGKTGERLRENLRAAKALSDAQFARTGHPATRIVYLYAWNEWHEGGILEPNAKDGARDLDIVSEVFALPRVPSPCLDEARCDPEDAPRRPGRP